MLTRTRMNPGRGLLIGSIAALMSFSASATDGTVTRSADAALNAGARLQPELKEYIEFLNSQLKEQIDEQLNNQSATRVKLALTEPSSRG